MSTMNREQALRCIQIAKKCLQENKLAKAEKFLNKSLRMYETIEAKSLLASLKTPQPSPAPNINTQPSASASTPNLNRNSTASASTSSIGSQSSSRMSSAEEVAMIKQILRAKDFYAILGVPRDADDKALKKAYRKKALKCHPDRNQAPGSEDAFKKLSKAYDCLRDSRQRQIYDQYGEDSPQMRRNGHSAQFQQMTPDDIIRMFFGGDFGGGQSGFHFHTQTRRRGGRGNGNGDNTQQMQGGPMVYIMQLLPIILVFFTMILPSLMMFGGSNSSSNSSSSSGGGLFSRNSNGYGHGSMENVYFSLDKTHPFTLGKKTDRLGTDYYIQPSRRGTWGYQRYKPPRLEQEVESVYLTKLIRNCDEQRRKEGNRLDKIMSNKVDARQRAKLLKKLMKNKKKLEKWDNKQCAKLFNYIDEL